MVSGLLFHPHTNLNCEAEAQALSVELCNSWDAPPIGDPKNEVAHTKSPLGCSYYQSH